MFYRCFI